ncbi:MAG: hypothetical protein ACK58L_06575 [Planctomycetota bacterium]
MKTIFRAFLISVALSAPAIADKPCQGSCKTTCQPGCSTVRWYKAKDGTYREMMPYAKALSRAEDADDMEPVLKKAQADLTAANEQLAQVRAESEKMKAELEARLADLEKQLEASKGATVAQMERADKAEAAHKKCIEEVASLRDEGKKKDELIAMVRGEFKTVSADRDSMKSANDKLSSDKSGLEKQVTDLTTSKNAADEALKKAQEEIEKLKQEAADLKKARIEEDASKEGDAPKEGEAAADAKPEAPPAAN